VLLYRLIPSKSIPRAAFIPDLRDLLRSLTTDNANRYFRGTSRDSRSPCCKLQHIYHQEILIKSLKELSARKMRSFAQSQLEAVEASIAAVSKLRCFRAEGSWIFLSAAAISRP
jgi:hypothetical protein